MIFDWSPYFAGYTFDAVITTSFTGAAIVAPIIALKLYFRVAVQAVRAVLRNI